MDLQTLQMVMEDIVLLKSHKKQGLKRMLIQRKRRLKKKKKKLTILMT